MFAQRRANHALPYCDVASAFHRFIWLAQRLKHGDGVGLELLLGRIDGVGGMPIAAIRVGAQSLRGQRPCDPFDRACRRNIQHPISLSRCNSST